MDIVEDDDDTYDDNFIIFLDVIANDDDDDDDIYDDNFIIFLDVDIDDDDRHDDNFISKIGFTHAMPQG